MHYNEIKCPKKKTSKKLTRLTDNAAIKPIKNGLKPNPFNFFKSVDKPTPAIAAPSKNVAPKLLSIVYNCCQASLDSSKNAEPVF